MSTEVPSSPQGGAPRPPSEHDAPVARAVPGRSWRRALAAIVALGATAVAAYSIKDQVPWPAAPEPAAVPVAAGAAPTAALRNALVVTRVESTATGASPVTFVSLGRTESPGQQALTNDLDPRRLLNELVRQAVLVAARDSLGAITRDAVIGEEAPAGTKVAQADVATSLTPSQRGSTLTVKPLDGKAGEPVVLKLPTADSAANPVAATYPRVLERAEVLAREELPKVLKALGVNGAPVVVKADGPLPGEVRERLNTLTFTEQFAAIRALHAAIRSDGESPERIGGLIRGYANLGTLTEFHWSIAHDVFKARALLAAQRWVARDSRSAEALRHRAYAYALAGLPRFALDDLAAARALPAGSGPASAWVPLVEAYCRFDTQALLDARAGPDRPLAVFLAFRTVEGPGSRGRTIEIGRSLLRENPECYRVHDAVCAAGGVSVQHEATTTPFLIYGREVPRRLQAMPGLPPGIAARLDDGANEVGAARALIQDGRSADRGEPSWGALARMMDEIRFVQVWRRAIFLANMLAVPAGDFVDSARPLIAAHPYRAAVECLGVDRARDYPRYQALARQVNIVDAEGTGIPFFLDILGNVDPAKGQDLFREAALREDTTEYDLMLFMPRLGAGDRAQDCRYLADVSPHSPVARAGLIETSWPEVEAKARAWEDEGAPPVLVALGYRYVELKRWDDAERCLSRSLKLAPEKYPYELLAHTFRARGDWKRWQETLDQYLERVDDYGLDHAQVRVQIANHLMDENRFKDAEPYAAAAAETWAAFGMICAARCYEGLKDWANAELWTRRDSERYPDGSWAKWYLFCKRTGHGDVDAARDYTAQYIASFGPRAGGEFRLASGCFYLMNGRKAEALEMFRGVTEGEALPASVLFSAFTADALGDTKLRDQCLERLVTDPKCAAAKAMPIYRLYRSALQAGDPVALDLAVVDKELAALPEENRGNAVFHVGWFLCLHGSPEKAAAYLKRCIDMDKTYFWYQYAAQEALNDPARVLGKPSRARVSRSAPATTGLDRL